MDKISIINQYFGWWIKFVNKVSKTTPWASKAYTCTKVLYSSHQSSATIPYYTILFIIFDYTRHTSMHIVIFSCDLTHIFLSMLSVGTSCTSLRPHDQANSWPSGDQAVSQHSVSLSEELSLLFTRGDRWWATRACSKMKTKTHTSKNSIAKKCLQWDEIIIFMLNGRASRVYGVSWLLLQTDNLLFWTTNDEYVIDCDGI